ncbi:MAG: GTPase [Candidatus Pacearchaeota archaeon]
MASTNQSPQYQQAESKYLTAKTDGERLKHLDEMIRECPKHKSAEKMLAQLKTRRKKLKEKLSKDSKTGKSTQTGIKKEDMQAVIVGFTNTGKSSLISVLTNADPEIAPYNFSTKKPIVGMMSFQSSQVQIIEVPAFESEYYHKGLVNTADTILILVNEFGQIKKIENDLENASGKRIVIFNINNKNLDERKIKANLQSNKYNFSIINIKEGKGIEDLREKIFFSFDKIRVYTKEPGKEKSEKPIILDPNSTVKDVAEKILHGFSKKVKSSFVTGPSSKFPNQKVGLSHKLKDLDVVEFRTR